MEGKKEPPTLEKSKKTLGPPQVEKKKNTWECRETVKEPLDGPAEPKKNPQPAVFSLNSYSKM